MRPHREDAWNQKFKWGVAKTEFLAGKRVLKVQGQKRENGLLGVLEWGNLNGAKKNIGGRNKSKAKYRKVKPGIMREGTEFDRQDIAPLAIMKRKENCERLGDWGSIREKKFNLEIT